MEPYPRKSGHCLSFDVSNFKYIKDLKMNGVDFEVFDSEEVNYEQIFPKTLKLLKYKNLVKGDLIFFCGYDCYRNNGVAIYDGKKIIKLNYEYDDYGCLPPIFTVITNRVPADYWSDLPNMRGISHNSIIWLDHSKVKNECIQNTKIVNGRVVVSFDYNERSYTLYDLTDDQYLDMVYSLENDYVPEEEYDYKERLQIVSSKVENNDLLMLNYALDKSKNIKLFLGGPFER